MACDLALRLMGGCPPDFAGGPVTLLAAAISINPGNGAMGQEQTSWDAGNGRPHRQRGGGS